MRVLFALMLSMGLAPAVVSAQSAYDREVALVIGLGDYAHLDDLPNARVDADAFAEHMHDRKAKVITLRDAAATRAGILDALDEAGALAAEGKGLLVVYFAGHGRQRGPAGAAQDYLVPHDGRPDKTSTWISAGELRQKARELSRVRHQLWIVSARYGRAEKAPDNAPDRRPPRLNVRRPGHLAAWLRSVTRVPARTLLGAGSGEFGMADGPPGAGSVFGNALVDALTRLPDNDRRRADLDGDGCVSATELEMWLQRYGSEPGKNLPFVETLDGHTRGAMVVLCDRAPKQNPLSPLFDL